MSRSGKTMKARWRNGKVVEWLGDAKVDQNVLNESNDRHSDL